MLQALEKGESLREKVWMAESTTRVESLRQRYMDTRNKISIDISLIVT